MQIKRIWQRALSFLMSIILVTTTISSNDSLTVNVFAEKVERTINDSINDSMKLWYKTEANINTVESSSGEWMQQALPLGNGNLGNLIFGGVTKERIHFNEKTLWTGGPSSGRPDYQFGNKNTAYTAQEIEEYRRILDDKTENVFNDSMGGIGPSSPIRFSGATLYKGEYQDFGDIWLDFSEMGITDKNVTNYRRELNLQTGIASTTFTYEGVDYTREHFVSNPDNVMVTRVLASEAGKLDVTIQMELNNNNLSGTTTLSPETNTCTIEGFVKDNGLKFHTTMKIIPSGGTITANTNAQTYSISGADSFMIIMAAETDYKNDYPVYRDTEKNLESVVSGHVNAAVGKSFDELKANHLADHQELFDRVELDLGEIVTDVPTNELMDRYRSGEYSRYLEVLSFQFGRYLTIAGSRGTLPSNLVGLWTIGGSAWTGDYHFNVNVQMNYWPVYVTNLAECGTTMVEYMENLREPGRLTAERIHGIENATTEHTGFVVHTENNPFGMTAPSNVQEYGWNPTGAAWAIQNLWAHYEFTQDVKYLRDVIYPIMKEAALFWDQYLWTSGYQVINDENSPYNGQARLVVAPSFSEEQGPTAVGTTYDQSLVWELYKECVQAAEILDVDEDLRASWADKMQKLDPIEINATNGIKEWYEETRVGTETGHNQSYAQAGNLAEISVPNSGWNIGHPGEQRHASHLVGLYPGTLINKENPEYMNAAIQSLTERGVYSTGWSKANKINLWARTGNGDKAYTLLNNLIGGKAAGLQYNLFDSHGSGGGETMKNGSPVWQIDGNYGLTAGVAEMLLQSQLGYVQFLPAIPEAWDEGEVQGLKARGNFTIGQKWSCGLADSFTVRYDGDEAYSEFSGEYEDIINARVYLGNQEIAVSKDIENGRIAFDAIRGETYVIDMTGTNVDQLSQKAEAFINDIHEDLSAVKEELVTVIASNSKTLKEVLDKAKLMDKMYREYLSCAETIYYMTSEEGLSYREIDGMYSELRQIQKNFLNNDQTLDYYRKIYEDFQNIRNIMQEQMNGREISFSKESGAISPDDALLTLSKSTSASMYQIRYTTDGKVPNSESALYEAAIELDAGKNTIVRAALFLSDQRVSPVVTKYYTGKIAVASVETAVEDWGEPYTPEKMIDGDTSTRWASKNVSSDIEIILNFNSVTSMNAMKFDQYVSHRNATDKFEIWSMTDGEYELVFEGSNLGNESDATELYYASKTFEFDTVTTDKIKIVIKQPYNGEPSFYEIQPLMMITEVIEPDANSASLQEMIALAKQIDRNSQGYINADAQLKNAFEESIVDAETSIEKKQTEIDSRESFLRNRYRRLGFGETDKSILEARIRIAEELLNGSYTRDSLYILNKALSAAKAVAENETALQNAIDIVVAGLKNAIEKMEKAGEVEKIVSSAELIDESGNWIDAAGGFKAANSDNAGKLSYEFTGNRIRILTVTGSDHGILHVVITNLRNDEIVYDENIDTYAATRTDGAELMNVSLENDTYLITFERNGVNPQQMGQGWVEVGQLSIIQKTVETVDRTSLEAAFAECNDLKEEEYTEESWTRFELAYEKAQEVYAKEDAETCTAEMEDMSKQLLEAKGLLAEAEPLPPTQEELVRAFVERMYTIVLNRDADPNGLDDWSAGLIEWRVDGAEVVNGFVNSPEFEARNLRDEDFIKTLYLAVLNREADEAGLADWLRAFELGYTRQQLIDGFVTSAEFIALCDSYGILAEITQRHLVTSFVERMYTVALGREADETGLEYWVTKLMEGSTDGKIVVTEFIMSPEFIARNLNDEDFIKTLYRTILNREATEQDVADWTAAIALGQTRQQIMNGFIESAEFAFLCDGYGISAILTQSDLVTNFVSRMYTIALGREADENGLNDWVTGLIDGVIYGAQVADGFIMSPEFETRGLNNEEYVKTLYLTFFNREAGEEDIAGWVSAMTVHGQSRRDVLKGFINAEEFRVLCENYGIIRGELAD